MKKYVSILFIALMIFIFPIQAEETNVVISFPLTSENRYTYELIVKGNGTLYDGEQAIRNGIMEYSLAIGDEKIFSIKADDGYEVREIIYNDEIQEGVQQTIKIQGVSSQSTMIVEFVKIEEKKETPTTSFNKIQNEIKNAEELDEKNSLAGNEEIKNTGNEQNEIQNVPVKENILNNPVISFLLLLIIFIILMIIKKLKDEKAEGS